ncbi:septum formation protein Maf [Candidatus Kaiserbacteria bacterium CG10_big_fil_rev_8_21_14_0_10_51_14]|uniref:Nucleoside triphosphate pyrophosphatase n=1 Tax=Candidatus Kaiserbacteria bacterium CG10_big_fil_rev_8_21_14_0_10_51_14 TaxID=1974610 RepID=A0A2H0UBY5_9BACT|nr:MAG: septum formation protein Maf [Candidatus Kaiserbacteria bacterium CG10_big_fil_rev_8_21_14_0_10_51_14]
MQYYRMRKVILASASPWRKKMLASTGIPFQVEESGYRENMKLKLAPRVLARRLALGKAKKVAARHRDVVVIGADTFVVFRGKPIGKPITPKRAVEVLLMLSGKRHTLLTGFAIVDSKTGRSFSKTVATHVTLRKLSKEEIERYVKTGEPLNAAGAYVIQGGGAQLMEKTEGDVNNVAGLPLADVVAGLKKFGLQGK